MSVLPTPDDRRPVAVLCGSVTRAVAALDAAEAWYREQGYAVRKPVKDDSRTPEEHAQRHYALIDACGPDDVVAICQVAGQRIGEQTTREMARALDRDVEMRHFVLPESEERAS